MRSLTSLIMDIYDQWDEQSWKTSGADLKQYIKRFSNALVPKMQKKMIQNIPDKDNVICSWDEEGRFHCKIIK